MKIILRPYLELMAWSAALVLSGLVDTKETHYSLCNFKLKGIGCCPGYGIGYSISYLLHGDI